MVTQHFYTFVAAALILLACPAVRQQEQHGFGLSGNAHFELEKPQASNKTRGGITFRLSIGTVKLDNLLPSDAAVRSIADKLISEEDDVLAFLEIDTMHENRLALWSRLREAVSEAYIAPAGDPFMDTEKGSRYALSVFVRRDRIGEVIIEDAVQKCCQDSRSPEMIMMRKVRIGEDGLLLIVGVQLSPQDFFKARQVQQLVQKLKEQRESAMREGRDFQAVLVGDLNSRLILPKYFHGRVWPHKVRWHFTSMNTSTMSPTLKIDSETSEDILRFLSFTNHRKLLLDWDSDYFEGTAISGNSVEPSDASNMLKEYFYWMIDWWKEKDMTPTMPSYQMTPWFKLRNFFQDFVHYVRQSVVVLGKQLVSSSQHQNFMITTEELLQQIAEAKTLIIPSSIAPSDEKIWEGVWSSSGLKLCHNRFRSEERFQKCDWLLDKCVEVDDAEQRRLQSELTDLLATNLLDMQAVEAMQEMDSKEMAMERLMVDMRKIMKRIQKTKHLFAGRRMDDDDARGFLASLPDRMFHFQSEVSYTTYKSKEAQKYLHQNAQGQPVYLQLGWLDKLGFSKGALGEFTTKEILSFNIGVDLLGYDHLMVHVRVLFTI